MSLAGKKFYYALFSLSFFTTVSNFIKNSIFFKIKFFLTLFYISKKGLANYFMTFLFGKILFYLTNETHDSSEYGYIKFQSKFYFAGLLIGIVSNCEL